MARLTYTTLHYIKAKPPPPPVKEPPVLSSSNNRRNFYRVGNGTHVSNDSGCALFEYELTNTRLATSPDSVDFLSAARSGNHHHDGIGGAKLGNGRRPQSPAAAAAALSRSKEAAKEDDVDLILALLKKLLVSEGDKEEEEDLKHEWEEAARVIDRFLFYIFFLATLLATVVTLVLMPLSKPEVPTNLPVDCSDKDNPCFIVTPSPVGS